MALSWLRLKHYKGGGSGWSWSLRVVGGSRLEWKWEGTAYKNQLDKEKKRRRKKQTCLYRISRSRLIRCVCVCVCKRIDRERYRRYVRNAWKGHRLFGSTPNVTWNSIVPTWFHFFLSYFLSFFLSSFHSFIPISPISYIRQERKIVRTFVTLLFEFNFVTIRWIHVYSFQLDKEYE